jgi:hypothetical protein
VAKRASRTACLAARISPPVCSAMAEVALTVAAVHDERIAASRRSPRLSRPR